MFSTRVVAFLGLEKIDKMKWMVIKFDVEIVFTFIDVPIPSDQK